MLIRLAYKDRIPFRQKLYQLVFSSLITAQILLPYSTLHAQPQTEASNAAIHKGWLPDDLHWEISGYIGIEELGFIQTPLETSQHRNYLSGVIEPELYLEWDQGSQNFAFVPFFRYSQHDHQRTHFDLRELTWMKVARDWELRIGFREVFWGVTEGLHLVNIINQTDLVENTDTEDKLGQPMINLALISDWGTIDLILLTGFRERTFPGSEGRLRSIPRVDVDNPRFEHSGAMRHLGYAIRWSHAIGDWDIGLSHFYGTGREPTLLPSLSAEGEPILIPYYQLINQTGLDVQATLGSWLWKLEAILRSGQGPTFFAATGGIEYTLFNLLETGLDLGLVIEYMYDSRGKRYVTEQSLFQDDFLAAVRLGFNDAQNTEVLAGVFFDRTDNAKFWNLEASRRFGENWKVELEVRLFTGITPDNPAYSFSKDDHVRMQVNYHF